MNLSLLINEAPYMCLGATQATSRYSPWRDNTNPHIIEPPQTVHQSSNTKLSRLVEWYPSDINVACKTRLQNQASVAFNIVALLVEVVHCEFGSIHYADEVDIENLQVWLCGLFSFL